MAGAIPAEVFDGLKIITKQQLSAEMDERLAGASDSAKAEAQESFARIEQAMQQLNPSQILAAMNSLLYDDKMSSEEWVNHLNVMSLLISLVADQESGSAFEALLAKVSPELYQAFADALNRYNADPTVANAKLLSAALWTAIADKQEEFSKDFILSSVMSFLESGPSSGGKNGISARKDALPGSGGAGGDASIDEQKTGNELVVMFGSVYQQIVDAAAARSEGSSFTAPIITALGTAIISGGDGNAQVIMVSGGRLAVDMIKSGASSSEIVDAMNNIKELYELRNSIVERARSNASGSELTAIEEELAKLSLTVAKLDNASEVSNLLTKLRSLDEKLKTTSSSTETKSILTGELPGISSTVDNSNTSAPQFGPSAGAGGSGSGSAGGGSGSGAGSGSSAGSGAGSGSGTGTGTGGAPTRTIAAPTAATMALGQASLTENLQVSKGFHYPGNVLTIGGKLIVADQGNERILIWNTAPTSNNQRADVVIGSNSLHARRDGKIFWQDPILNNPVIGTDGTKLFIGMMSSVLIYNSVPTTNGASPDLILGNSSMATANTMVTTCAAGKFNYIGGITSDGTRLVVSDTNNNRIQIWNTIPTTSEQAPDRVLGQADFTTCGYNRTNTTTPAADSLYNPKGVAIAGGKLLVADYQNARVLVWNNIATVANGANADVVFGNHSATVTTNHFTTKNTTISQSGMNEPRDIFYDGTYLFVSNASRVLRFNGVPTTNNANADGIWGQDNWTVNGGDVLANRLYEPAGITKIGSDYYVADNRNHRVQRFSTVGTGSSAAPNALSSLGQENTSSARLGYNETLAGIIDGTHMTHPSAGCVNSSGKFFILDQYNNRVMMWNSIPTSSSTPADYIIGQTNATSFTPDATAQIEGRSFTAYQGGMACNDQILAVSDQVRILIWNISSINGDNIPATRVIGQPNFSTSTANLNSPTSTSMYPRALALTNQYLIAADPNRYRILIWNLADWTSGLPANNEAADLVLGASNFTTAGTYPSTNSTTAGNMYDVQSIFTDNTRIMIADGGNSSVRRVLIWNSFPTTNGQAANVVVGRQNLTDADGWGNWTTDNAARIENPTSVFYDGTRLYIGEKLHNPGGYSNAYMSRVGIWRPLPTTNGATPEYAFGYDYLFNTQHNLA